MTLLGKLERVDLRDVWQHEAHHFTPWLAQPENLAALGKELGLDLELVGQEVAVGPYAADIVCKDSLSGIHVLIENQLEKTDHNHLGQLLTYAAGLDARTVIWVAARFTDEHRAALDWLNEITQEDWQFFGLEIELWRIGNSPSAPKFNIICRPNDWSRAVREEATKAQGSSPTQQQQLRYWTSFKEYMAEKKLWAPRPSAQSWAPFSVGRTGFSIELVIKKTEEKLAARLYVNCKDLPPKQVFRYLEGKKDSIHQSLGFPLEWDDLPGRIGCVVFVVRPDSPLDDESRWPEYHAWMESTLSRMVAVFKPLIQPLKEGDLPPPVKQEVATEALET